MRQTCLPNMSRSHVIRPIVCYKKVSEYDQEIAQSQTADKPVAS